MKTKIIITIITIAVLGIFGYEFYLINQVKKQADLAIQVLTVMGTSDQTGWTGFDKLVLQTLLKINQNAKK